MHLHLLINVRLMLTVAQLIPYATCQLDAAPKLLLHLLEDLEDQEDLVDLVDLGEEMEEVAVVVVVEVDVQLVLIIGHN
jgi:hypothetical protein